MSLGKAITLVESTRKEDRPFADQLIEACIAEKKMAKRIAITGVPGVGKSTFIESFGMLLIGQGKSIAVLSVDPSSQDSKGSILGDKTRMETLGREENAFIRPSPSGSSLGGVARKTQEAILICEAAGFDYVLVETVGVGQSETRVHSMVDFFVLLKLAGAGDELQGIKRGIMELADLVVINKAEDNNKDAVLKTRRDFKAALHLFPPKKSTWTAQVLQCSALHKIGLEEIEKKTAEYFALIQSNDWLQKNRIQQNEMWFQTELREQLVELFLTKEGNDFALKNALEKIRSGESSVLKAVRDLTSS